MRSFYRALAKFTPCPLSESGLSVIAGKDLRYLDDFVCAILLESLQQQAGSENLADCGRAKFGVNNFKRVYEEGKLPCLRELIAMASAVGLTVIYKNYPYKGSGARAGRDFYFAEQFDEKSFRKFLVHLSTDRYSSFDSEAMREVRHEILEKLSGARPRFEWSTLIRYSGACGYQLSLFFEPKSSKDGGLTPNHSRNAKLSGKEEIRLQSEKWWVSKENDEQYQALLRRLDYPA